MLYFMAEMSLTAVTYLLLFHTRHQADCLTPEFCFVGLVGFWWEEKTGAPRSVPVKLLQMVSTGFQRHKVKHQKFELLPYRVSHSLSFYASWLVGALLWVGCISQASNMFFLAGRGGRGGWYTLSEWPQRKSVCRYLRMCWRRTSWLRLRCLVASKLTIS